MRLSELLDRLGEEALSFCVVDPKGRVSSTRIETLTCDSRNVSPGTLFCCFHGTQKDGHDFAPEAVNRGAVALLCERSLNLPVPQIVVPRVRTFMGRVASVFYGKPVDRLKMVAVTGTNGKSTSSYMIRSLLHQAGIKTGLLGTIVYHDGLVEEDADRTTPENILVQDWLSRMVENGCEACVMEASSHGLEQGRIEGCLFDWAAFSNLTPEHLDYHATMDNYFESKKKLFTDYMRGDWKAAVNIQDAYGKKLFENFKGKMVPYQVGGPKEGICTAQIREASLRGMVLDFTLPDGKRVEGVSVPLIGSYNVENALQSITVGWLMGLPNEVLARGLSSMPQVPGRLERYLFSNGVCAVIDYAHSPDGLEKVLKTLRSVCEGRLWAVFGLGGERYTPNRPLMGALAARLADEIVVTMDNPRSEDPASIAEQIVSGIKSEGGNTPYRVILNRKEAVFSAMNAAQKGDIVLISGKGPEKYLIFADHKEPYNDKEALFEWASENSMEAIR